MADVIITSFIVLDISSNYTWNTYNEAYAFDLDPPLRLD